MKRALHLSRNPKFTPPRSSPGKPNPWAGPPPASMRIGIEIQIGNPDIIPPIMPQKVKNVTGAGFLPQNIVGPAGGPGFDPSCGRRRSRFALPAGGGWTATVGPPHPISSPLTASALRGTRLSRGGPPLSMALTDWQVTTAQNSLPGRSHRTSPVVVHPGPIMRADPERTALGSLFAAPSQQRPGSSRPIFTSSLFVEARAAVSIPL